LFIKSVRACGLDLGTRDLLMTDRCRLDCSPEIAGGACRDNR